MRRPTAVALLMGIVLSGLAGCGSKAEPTLDPNRVRERFEKTDQRPKGKPKQTPGKQPKPLP